MFDGGWGKRPGLPMPYLQGNIVCRLSIIVFAEWKQVLTWCCLLTFYENIKLLTVFK